MCIRDRCLSSTAVSSKNHQYLFYKVSDSYENELTSSDDKIVENELFKSDIVKTKNDNEVCVEVELNNKVLASVDEIVRESEERLGGQRAEFPRVYGETEFSQMFYEDRVSTRGYVEDKVSSNSPLIFCGVLGLSLIHI